MKNSLLFMAIALTSTTLCANNLYADVQITELSNNKEQGTWISVNPVTPKYPVELAMNNVTGCGVFKVLLDDKGKTDSIELIQSVPKKKIIYKPSERIIKKLQWETRPNTIAQAEEKIIRLDYCMGGHSIEEAQTMCVRQSQLACEI